ACERMGNVPKSILSIMAAMMVTVPAGLLLGLYGETTKEYRERRFSSQPKLTIQLQHLRDELAELRKRTDPLGGKEVGSRTSEIGKSGNPMIACYGSIATQIGISRISLLHPEVSRIELGRMKPRRHSGCNGGPSFFCRSRNPSGPPP